MNKIDSEELKFKLPFNAIISGATSSGKTTFLINFLQNHKDLIEPNISSILYCYGQYHDYIPEMEKNGISICSGLPSETILDNLAKKSLLILDDLMLYASEKFLTDLFTKKSHHKQLGVIFLTQNLFEKAIKVARFNSQYLILMRSPNSALQIRNIGIQLFPKQLNYFLSAYEQATEKPYSYLLVDLHAASNSLLKLRTNIFPDDNLKTLFIPKNV